MLLIGYLSTIFYSKNLQFSLVGSELKEFDLFVSAMSSMHEAMATTNATKILLTAFFHWINHPFWAFFNCLFSSLFLYLFWSSPRTSNSYSTTIPYSYHSAAYDHQNLYKHFYHYCHLNLQIFWSLSSKFIQQHLHSMQAILSIYLMLTYWSHEYSFC